MYSLQCPTFFAKICLLCISTSLWVLAAPKNWLKHFFQPFFNLFWSFETFYFFFGSNSDVFCWFQPWNHCKRFKMIKKGWKTAEKNVSISIWELQAPKSWLKYTTSVFSNHFESIFSHIEASRNETLLKRFLIFFFFYNFFVNIITS